MSDETNVPLLSALAQQRRQAMLPSLLAAVRQRRQRRQLAQAAIAVALGALIGLWQPWRAAELLPKTRMETTATWTTITDDATVLQRCEIVSVSRAEWFVDDAGLQDLLAGAARPAGLVRIAGQVLVDPAVIDRWDAETP